MGNPSRAIFGSLPAGDEIRATLKLMVGTARHFLKPASGDCDRIRALLQVRVLASSLVQGIGEKDYFSECAALHAFAAENEARMEAMASARNEIERTLSALQSTRRLVRQEEITDEIIELAAGETASQNNYSQ